MTDEMTPINSLMIRRALAEEWMSLRATVDDFAPSQWEIAATTDRGTVTERLLGASHFGSSGPIPESLPEAIAWLQGYLRQVPKELRDTAKLEIESEGGYEDCHHVEVTLSYKRPETDEEWAARRANVERRLALADSAAAERDRKEFERLKAKFG